MGEYPDFRTPDREQSRRFTNVEEADDTEQSQQTLQEIAHDRGRICKKRGCVVCAPLVERRRQKKKERKSEAQAVLHAKGQPCGRSSCSLRVCVDARSAAEPLSAPDESPVPPPTTTPTEDRTTGAFAADARTDEATRQPDRTLRRQAERHRVGLPCGSQDCTRQECIDGLANERTRRHRAHRPCRSAACDNPICVAGRSTN